MSISNTPFSLHLSEWALHTRLPFYVTRTGFTITPALHHQRKPAVHKLLSFLSALPQMSFSSTPSILRLPQKSALHRLLSFLPPLTRAAFRIRLRLCASNERHQETERQSPPHHQPSATTTVRKSISRISRALSLSLRVTVWGFCFFPPGHQTLVVPFRKLVFSLPRVFFTRSAVKRPAGTFVQHSWITRVIDCMYYK